MRYVVLFAGRREGACQRDDVDRRLCRGVCAEACKKCAASCREVAKHGHK